MLHLVEILLRNLVFLTPMFLCHLQRMLSGTVVIFIEFLAMHWNFDSMLNAFVMVARATMRVYMFCSYQFHAPFMSPFFRPHEPFNDVSLDDIRPPFHPLRYPLDGKSNFDARGARSLGVVLPFGDSSVFGFFCFFCCWLGTAPSP